MQERDQGEVLKVIYDPYQEWQSYKQWVIWIAENVRAMIGPHGGMWNNVR